ncbi:recombinase family protein [Pseudosulfitobacter sp. DSM 107133]|uniref:recombinase family protein n=1 Tax=Pseudosulfitobacter sp. DSM 107133 TaxID=2883100 RepID=UPI000DF23FB5|nr:recombinase family protein [Pseudosulfitobacter sp. DSM 107133]UOA30233.1 DNA-invertase hin [Pseudosulfitobacter sp. DSM 107133]
MKIGYARVSTQEQNIDRQVAALEAEGCELIYSEKVSGKNMTARPELKKAITALNPDDVFVVAEWDRATRSFTDGVQLMADIGDREAMLQVLDRPLFDLTTPMGKAMLGVLSAIAQDERERRLKQAEEGRAHAKRRGQHMGRKPSLTAYQQAEVLRMKTKGKSVREIAAMFNVSASTISRIR